LIDHFRTHEGILKESYVGIVMGERENFIVLGLDLTGENWLEQIWIRHDQVLSVWVYKDE